MGFFYDPTYLILLLAMVVISVFARVKLNSTYKRYLKEYARSGMSGKDAANAVLQYGGVADVTVDEAAGVLTDHYDPRNKTIQLSKDIYEGTSVAAIGIAAHEAGHALQHHQGYVPLKIRNAIIPITNIGSKLAMPLIVAGLILGSLSTFGGKFYILADIGIIAFSLLVFFQLITLPVEFDASRRALQIIDANQILTQEEREGAKKVLFAAAMTYVAALAVAVLQLLRLLAIVGGGRGRR